VIGLLWTASAPSAGSTSASTGESSAKKDEAQEPKEGPADSDTKASWISFERILLLAVVVVNFLLLATVAWSYRRARRSSIDADLLQKLQAIEAQLQEIVRVLRAGSTKTVTPPAPAITDSASRVKSYEMPREQTPPASRPSPVRQTIVSQESLPLPERIRPVGESRSPEGDVWKLVNRYCQSRESSIVDLNQWASDLELTVGSPSSINGQRHVLNDPNQDGRLFAIKEGDGKVLFVVVGADAIITESEWLDLFTRRSFPGVSPVRSTRPAIVNAVSGDVEEMGELEVLGSP